MAAHRYWRLTGFAIKGNGPLELSEARWYVGGAPVDGSATLTCTIAPSGGSLADLKDGLSTSAVSWPLTAHSSSGFALTWDLTGSGSDVETLCLGSGGSSAAYPLDVVVQYSDDGMTWGTAQSVIQAAFPGVYALTPTVGSGIATDSYYANVSLLLHGDGANNSTVFTDASAAPKAVTRVGAAKISTAQSKFGGAAMSFDGTSDYLTVATHDDFEFGAGDFTEECFIYLTSLATAMVINKRANSSIYSGVNIYVSAGSAGAVASYDGSTWSVNLLSAAILSVNTWYHLALVRAGNAYTLYVNGSSAAGASAAGSVHANTSALTIGGTLNGAFCFPGYIDEVRITKGVARYTATFTPPTTAFGSTGYSVLPVDNQLLPRTRGVALAPDRLAGDLLPNGAASGNPRAEPFFDAYYGGLATVRGSVKEKNLPVNTPLHRRVLLLDQRSQQVIRETWSDASTGAYIFRGVRQDLQYTVLAYDYTQTYRAVVADNITPEMLP